MSQTDDDENSSIDNGNIAEKNEENVDTIIDELLSYVCFYINNSCLDNIKKIVSSFYSQDEILKSKKHLWDVCSKNLSPYTERKTTDKRSSSEANLADIFKGIKELDSGCCLPNFVAKNLERIPERQPEDTNIVCMLNRICSVEKVIKDLEQNIIFQSNSFKTFQDDIEGKIDSMNTDLNNSVANLKLDLDINKDKLNSIINNEKDQEQDLIDDDTLRRYRRLKDYDAEPQNIEINEQKENAEFVLRCLRSHDEVRILFL